MRRMSQVRDQQYGLLRGLYRGESDVPEAGEGAQPRLHAVTLDARAAALARPLAALELEELGVQVSSVRRPGEKKKMSAEEAGPLREGDVVVLLGAPEMLAAAETRLRQG
jgi:CPA2 family monovalent cation:H+ antiporter-2